MSKREFHPLVKQLLDGDITLADLPAELRVEGEEALRLLAVVDRRPVALPGMTERVMAALAQPRPAAWRRLLEPREIRLRIRPWILGPALALAATLVLWLAWPRTPGATPGANGIVTVHFVLSAPEARAVGVAGSFNQWNPTATPLVRSGPKGMWTATIKLPAGQHQYVFVVDGVRWVPDPSAPAVDDGFGRRNSVLSL